MENPVRSFRQLDFEVADFDDLLKGRGTHQDGLLIPREGLLDELLSTLDGFTARNDALPEEDPVLAMLKTQMGYFLDAKRLEARQLFTNPAGEIEQLSITLEFLLMDDCRPNEIRGELFIRRMEQAARYYREGLAALLPTLEPKKLSAVGTICRQIAEACDGWIARLPRYFPQLTDRLETRLTEAIRRFHGEMELWLRQVAELTAALPAQSQAETVAADPEEYRRQLMTLYGVDLSELLLWCDDEVAATREEVLSLSARLPIADAAPKTVKEAQALLQKYAGPCSSPEEMFARAEAYTQRTKALAHQMVRLPENEVCLIDEIKETLKSSYPWGGYRGGDPKRKPPTGAMFYNQYNYRAISDGWIKLNALHEAYPGHHVQYVRTTTDPIPEILKRGARHVTMLEGTPHRTEQVFAGVFDEDPFFPVFAAYRRHHTAVRIKADLMLRYHGAPIPEVVRLYEDTMGFDTATARGQVLAQELMYGYFTNYYYGVKKLTGWEAEQHRSVKEYTELLFSAGLMSLDSFRKLLDFTPEQLEHFRHDFASLRMQP